LLLLLLELKLDKEVVPEGTPEVVAEFVVILEGEVARLLLLLPPVA